MYYIMYLRRVNKVVYTLVNIRNTWKKCGFLKGKNIRKNPKRITKYPLCKVWCYLLIYTLYMYRMYVIINNYGYGDCLWIG